ncbi:hypothetical protein ACH47X_18545 [Promicromonospora kroppenstedtii]|uniref:Uncharacterized protein n=1 Tax=Promicromonospora kroppenstedtii TaxID=440482 RepID=A0ABW7XPB9_9MICO
MVASTAEHERGAAGPREHELQEGVVRLLDRRRRHRPGAQAGEAVEVLPAVVVQPEHLAQGIEHLR